MTPTPQQPYTRGFRALVDDRQWHSLLTHGTHRTFTAGEPLLHQGSPSRLVHALLQGRVRVSYTEADGHEVLIAIRGPGDLLGEYAQRDRGTHMASVWAVEDCLSTVLTADAFESAVHLARLELPLQQYILHKYREIPQRLWSASNLQTDQRMALLMLEMLNADPSAAGTAIPMTQQQIADSLGVARSSVTRLLAHWRESGLVRVRQSRLEVLDRAGLARRGNRS
jgi:CRP-like cAMP-binding protein